MTDMSMCVPSRSDDLGRFLAITTAATQSGRARKVRTGRRRPAASTLRAVIGAAFVAAVAVDADPRDVAGVLDPLEDEARQVFQGRQPERLDPVEQLVVEGVADVGHAAREQAEIDYHSSVRIRRAAHGDFGAER